MVPSVIGRVLHKWNHVVMELTAGSRWKSTVCDTEIVVVRRPDGEQTLCCGGADMVPVGTDAVGGTLDSSLAAGTQLGKRYTDQSSGLEVLCTKAGKGTLTFGGAQLELKAAKPLPSSD